MPDLVFTCCYEPSDVYTAEYVYRLKEGVESNTTVDHRFICFTNEELPGVETRTPLFDVPGWWNQVNVFGMRAFEQAVYFDLDTVIAGNIDWIGYRCRDFCALPRVRNGKIQTGIMKYTPEHAAYVTDEFRLRRSGLKERGCFVPPIKGEEKSVALNFFGEIFAGRWVRLAVGCGEEIVIYKNHYRGRERLESPSIICFSCRPRPHEVDWLENYVNIKYC